MHPFVDPLCQIRAQAPLVQCITNFVTVNDCANILLASGASPSMCQHPHEAPQAVVRAKALVLNLGAIDLVDSMVTTGKAAVSAHIPVVLDPVAAGGTAMRRNASQRLLSELPLSVIRGNASEIRFLAGLQSQGRGVDVGTDDAITYHTLPQAIKMANALAQHTGSIIAISGVLDVISDGSQCVVLRNGCATMARITGSGCMLTSLIGGFCGAMPKQLFPATVSAMAVMGVCGELAEKKRLQNATGNATFRTDLIDAVFTLTTQQLEEGIRYDLYT